MADQIGTRREALERELQRIGSQKADYAPFFTAGLASLFVFLPRLVELDQQPVFWLLAPVLPLSLLAYVVRQARRVIISTYYARSLEAELKNLYDRPTTRLDPFGAVRPPVPGWATLDASIFSVRRGSPSMAIAGLVYNAGAVVLVTTSVVVCISQAGRTVATVVMGSMYGTLIGFLVLQMVIGAVWGRRVWADVVHSVVDGKRAPERRMGWQRVRYLLIPRPRGLLVRGVVFFAVPFLLVRLLAGETIGDFIILFVAYELLWCQGRYVANDLAGWHKDALIADRGHVRAANIWPRTMDVLVNLSCYATGRMGLGLALLFVVPTVQVETALIVVASSVGAALVYETVTLLGARRRRRCSAAMLAGAVVLTYFVRASAGLLLAGSTTGLPIVLFHAVVGAVWVEQRWHTTGSHPLWCLGTRGRQTLVVGACLLAVGVGALLVRQRDSPALPWMLVLGSISLTMLGVAIARVRRAS